MGNTGDADNKTGFVLAEKDASDPSKWIIKDSNGTTRIATGKSWPANPADQDGVPGKYNLFYLSLTHPLSLSLSPYFTTLYFFYIIYLYFKK
jgi:hypothetical protein